LTQWLESDASASLRIYLQPHVSFDFLQLLMSDAVGSCHNMCLPGLDKTGDIVLEYLTERDILYLFVPLCIEIGLFALVNIVLEFDNECCELMNAEPKNVEPLPVTPAWWMRNKSGMFLLLTVCSCNF